MSDDLEELLRKLVEQFLSGKWPNVVVHSDDTVDWVLVALTGLGLLLTALIAWFTLRATRSADQAQRTASSAQTEATLALARATEAWREALAASASAADRQADALRAIVEQTAGEQVDEAPVDLNWTIERDIGGKNRWLIRNLGPGIARQVTVEGDDDVLVWHEEARDIPPFDLVQFSVERTMASPPANIVAIEWTDALGNRRSRSFVVT